MQGFLFFERSACPLKRFTPRSCLPRVPGIPSGTRRLVRERAARASARHPRYYATDHRRQPRRHFRRRADQGSARSVPRHCGTRQAARDRAPMRTLRSFRWPPVALPDIPWHPRPNCARYLTSRGARAHHSNTTVGITCQAAVVSIRCRPSTMTLLTTGPSNTASPTRQW